MRQAIDAMRAFLAGQQADLDRQRIVETWDQAEVSGIPLMDWTQALELADAVAEQHGWVELRFLRDEDEGSLRSMGLQQWRLDGEPDAISGALAIVEPRDRWASVDLQAVIPESLEGAQCRVVLEKAPWRDGLDGSESSVWVGVSTASLVDWMTRSTWSGAAQRFFERPAALVWLDDWVGPAASAGSRLSVFGEGPPPASPHVAARWPEEVDEWRTRAIDLEVDEDFPAGDLRDLVGGMAIASAAWLIAEERNASGLRPSRSGETTWHVPGAPRAQGTTIPVIQLARWVTRDANATRLAVARLIASERIPDPFSQVEVTPIVSTAEIAYQTSVDAHVQAALRTQLDLEHSFQDADAKVSATRDALRDAVDQTVIRALTASLGIGVAALTVSQARGWPTVLAALAVAGYVLFTAWWVLRTMRTDVVSRFDALYALIEERQLGLGDDVAARIAEWKDELDTRAKSTQLWLTVSAVAIIVGGVFLGVGLHRPPPGRQPQSRGPTPSQTAHPSSSSLASPDAPMAPSQLPRSLSWTSPRPPRIPDGPQLRALRVYPWQVSDF